MITGDHKDTAVAIAKEIGLKNTERAITGKDIETMTDQELSEVVLKMMFLRELRQNINCD